MKITTTLNQFLALLRAGLWEKSEIDASLFNDGVDWDEIFFLSRSHCVEALVWDGILQLPATIRPERALSLQWFGIVVRIKQSNELVNRNAVELMTLFEQESLNPVLLKGAGVAQLYKNPSQRGCGDIDIYIGEGGIDRACEIVETKLGAKIKIEEEDDEHEFHKSFTYKGVNIELHFDIISLFTKAKTEELNKRVGGWYPHNRSFCRINDVQIAVPPPQFNGEYIFLHMYKHFFLGGVGLRQVCDWAMQLNALEGKVQFNNLLQPEGWRVFACLAVDLLGAQPQVVPFYDKAFHDKALRALEVVLFDGNFGMSSQKDRPKGFWSGKLHTLRCDIKRMLLVRRILREELNEYVRYRNYPSIIVKYLGEILNFKKNGH